MYVIRPVIILNTMMMMMVLTSLARGNGILYRQDYNWLIVHNAYDGVFHCNRLATDEIAEWAKPLVGGAIFCYFSHFFQILQLSQF